MAEGEGVAPSLNFSLSENLRVEKMSSKNANVKAQKPPFSENLRSKIKILSSHKLMSQKFATVCCKTATS